MSINSTKKIRIDRTLNTSNLNEFSPRTIFSMEYGNPQYQSATGTFVIPNRTSHILNDSGFITQSNVPNKTSDLTNDSGFITEYSAGPGILIYNGTITNLITQYNDTLARAAARSAISAGSGITYDSDTGVISAVNGGANITASQYVTKYTLAFDQALTNGTDNIVAFNTVSHDPLAWFNTSTSKFQPSIAGYYKITSSVWFSGGVSGPGNQFNIQIRKNGGGVSIVQAPELANSGQSLTITDSFYLNGTTDYLQVTAYVSAGTVIALHGGNGTYFEAFLIGVANPTGNSGFSGSYLDLTNKPTLATVATSGSYLDLTNKPTIPTNTNQLTNGNAFITLTNLSAGTGITYNNTTGVISSSITQYTDTLARAALSAGSGISYNSTTGVISATGGFSGSYLDLTNKPTIPTNTNQLTNGNAFITLTNLSAGTGITYNNTTGVISSSITQYTDTLARGALSFVAGSGGYNSSTGVITIPTNTSHLTNGAGFITASSITGKQDTLVSGTNIKTINGTSLLGSGDITISGDSGGGTTLPSQTGNSGKYLGTDGSNLVWSSLASSNNFDFGFFVKKFSDPISYILDTIGLDFGTFTQTENLPVDLGTF